MSFNLVCTGVMLLTFLGACGYHRPQAVLSPPTEGQSQTQKEVLVRIKPLRDFECSYYFDNRLVSRGVQPLQLYIQNDSDRYYVLSGSDISLPLLGKRDVGSRLYKNIVGRSVVWFVGALFFWKLFVPVLFVDTLFCLQANKEIGADLTSLCVNPKQKLVIAPHSRTHKVLFVASDMYHHHLMVPLQEQGKEETLSFRF